MNNFHMLNVEVLAKCKPGLRMVKVAVGLLFDKPALIADLLSFYGHSATLHVGMEKPLPMNSPLRAMDRCIVEKVNGSNTVGAVNKASFQAIDRLAGFLN